MRRRAQRALPVAVLLALAVPAPALALNEYDPSEEFRLPDWLPIHLGPLNLSINKAVAYLWLGSILTVVLGVVLMRVRLRVRADRRQTVGEMVYDVIQTQIAEQGLPSRAVGRWFPYVAALFLYIWVLNMVSFVPLPLSNDKFHLFGVELPTWGIYAATAQLSVTLMLAILSFVFTHVEGFRYNRLRYFKSFVPAGVPKVMIPFMAVLETISHFFRVVSLSVRLYANMLAGHMLILIFIGLIFVIGNVGVAVITVPAATVFYLFEVVIVVSIQAYIFAALTAIYIGSAIEPEH